MSPTREATPAAIVARGLDHVVLRVRDLERSLGFYRDALGFGVERRIDELGLVQLRAGTALIDLVPIDSPLGRAGGGMPEPGARNVDHFALALAAFDEDAIRALAERHGIPASETAERYGAGGFGPSIYLTDPDGNTVELKGPARRRDAEDRSLAATRSALLEAARAMDRAGLVEGTAGNLSARAASGEIVLTPTAMRYAGMEEDDLVVTDPDGRVLAGRHAPTTELELHLACLRRHPEIAAVVHSHPVHASMFAACGRPIPCVIEEVELYVGGDVPVAAYHPTGSRELGLAVADLLHDRAAALLANHGLVVVAGSPAEAVELSKLVERTARIVAGAERIGTPTPLPEAARERFRQAYRDHRRRGATPVPSKGERPVPPDA